MNDYECGECGYIWSELVGILSQGFNALSNKKYGDYKDLYVNKREKNCIVFVIRIVLGIILICVIYCKYVFYLFEEKIIDFISYSSREDGGK